ncbi:MAG: hypothetical protein RMY64_31080 [Nostoc sp. DedQUE08]|nr:hypothetical protein [Nostoc sp. DedQUE08]
MILLTVIPALNADIMPSLHGCYTFVVVISAIECCRIKAQLKPRLASSQAIYYRKSIDLPYFIDVKSDFLTIDDKNQEVFTINLARTGNPRVTAHSVVFSA